MFAPPSTRTLVAAPQKSLDFVRFLCLLREGLGDAHFVAVPSSAKVPPAAVTADMLVAPSLNDAFFKDTVAKHGSFPVRASERSAYVIDGLAAGQAYDVFFVIEVCATIPEANAHKND